MYLEQLYKLFPIHLPISKDGIFWNGKPGEFSNIGFNLNWSQKFGYTPYALNTGIYGAYNGKVRPHNGIDIAGDNGTPLTMPCRGWVSCTGYDKTGYGNYIFFETEPITLNGETIKIEYVLAHMEKLPTITTGKWHNEGECIGLMGTTGMSSGTHTHFGVRLLSRNKDGSWNYLFNNEESMALRGYVDPEPFLIETLIYDKQILINNKTMLEKNEKKFIMEGNGAGRKFVVVNGKLREITKDRESAAAIYVMTNNNLGITIDSSLTDTLPLGEDF